MDIVPSNLAGKVILVTGAARRMGAGIARELAARGARVAIHYGTREEEARRTAKECGDAPLFRADLVQVAEIERLMASVADHFGRLDGLVNNAARFTELDPLAITEADWDFVHSVNLKATFFCCQQAAKRMLENGGGRIVNISSLGGIRPWSRHAHYCASKAGVIMLTRALAKAWAPDISVNSVAPGVVPFEETDEARIQQFVRGTPARRAGTVDDVSEAVVFFLSTTKFITAQVVAVDGGLSQK
ncbi:MAG: SDR family NAD(P)-dependent oxidoreductase [Bryobacteraceae bacterium]